MAPFDKFIPLLEKLQDEANEEGKGNIESTKGAKPANNMNVDDHFTINMLKNDLNLIK